MAFGWSLAERTKSEMYSDFLAVLNSQRCQLLDLPRLKSQLLSLERSVRSGGRDLIDHPRGQHDDLINAAVGALLQAGGRQRFRSRRCEIAWHLLKLADLDALRCR